MFSGAEMTRTTAEKRKSHVPTLIRFPRSRGRDLTAWGDGAGGT